MTQYDDDCFARQDQNMNDDESELVDKYQRVEVVDCDAPGMGGTRRL